MAYTLFLRETSDDRFDWLLNDSAGAAVALGHNDESASIQERLSALELNNIQITGIIPALDVTHCGARIPGRQKRVIHQALPFAVEEQVAQDIETVHLALGDSRGNEWQVAAVDLKTFEGHLARLNDLEYPVTAVYADAMLVPVDAEQWTVLVEDQQALIHSRSGPWYAVPVDALSVFVDSLVHAFDGDTPPAIRILTTQEAQETHRMALAALDQNPDANVTTEELDQSVIELFAHSARSDANGAINLCQGRFAPADSRRSEWHRWRPVAVIAVIGLILQLGLMIGEGYYYEQQARRFDTEAMGIYQDLFPDDRRTHPNNLERVLTGRLRAAEQGGGGGDFLTLLRYAGHQYQQLNNPDQLQFESIQFSAQRGELRVELRGESFSQLDAMRSGLSQSGLSAQIGSVVNSNDGTRARLTITQGG